MIDQVGNAPAGMSPAARAQPSQHRPNDADSGATGGRSHTSAGRQARMVGLGYQRALLWRADAERNPNRIGRVLCAFQHEGRNV